MSIRDVAKLPISLMPILGSLWLIGAVHTVRAILLTLAQIAGGICGAGLVALLTPYQGVSNTITKVSL